MNKNVDEFAKGFDSLFRWLLSNGCMSDPAVTFRQIIYILTALSLLLLNESIRHGAHFSFIKTHTGHLKL